MARILDGINALVTVSTVSVLLPLAMKEGQPALSNRRHKFNHLFAYSVPITYISVQSNE
jgi:hypothetical protein